MSFFLGLIRVYFTDRNNARRLSMAPPLKILESIAIGVVGLALLAIFFFFLPLIIWLIREYWKFILAMAICAVVFWKGLQLLLYRGGLAGAGGVIMMAVSLVVAFFCWLLARWHQPSDPGLPGGGWVDY
jgi:hypothetical protein